MPSNLIVHSQSTRDYAFDLGTTFSNVSYKQVQGAPGPDTVPLGFDHIYAIGGGGVIDYAKILAGPMKRCIAIPTTAAGSSETSHAVIWDLNAGRKINRECPIPVTQIHPDFLKNYPPKVLQSTYFDALSHAWESRWSRKRTEESEYYADLALAQLHQYDPTLSPELLIIAGIWAGKAIQLTGTNVIHACSYPLTLRFGIPHGIACGLFLSYFYKIVETAQLRRLGDLLEKKGRLLNQTPIHYPELKSIDPEELTAEALQYSQILTSVHTKIEPMIKEAYQYVKGLE